MWMSSFWNHTGPFQWYSPCPPATAAVQWYFRSRNGFPLLWPLSKKEIYAHCWEIENLFILSNLTRLRRNSQEKESISPFYFSHPSASFLSFTRTVLPSYLRGLPQFLLHHWTCYSHFLSTNSFIVCVGSTLSLWIELSWTKVLCVCACVVVPL